MARIVINEKDLTTATKAPDTTDIVFVPGLMGFTSSSRNGLQGKKYTPTLCQTVTAFENYFGKEPYQFQNAETYNGIEVEEGDFDPGYIYAKELLTAGLQVVYEALDTDINQEEYSLVQSQPDNFTENYTSYYTKGTFTPITSWDDADIYTYVKDASGNITCAITSDIKNTTSLVSDKYYKFTKSNDTYTAIPSISNDAAITPNWNDSSIIRISDSGSIYLKTPTTIASGAEYYMGITNRVPNIPAKNEAEGATNTGLVINSKGDIEFFEDGIAVTKGLVADKSGNIYFINSTKKAIKDTWYDVAESYLNGLLPKGRYFFDANGIVVSPDTVVGYKKTTASTEMTKVGNCVYILGTASDNTARANTYSYIDSLNGVYEKNSAEQQLVLSRIYSQLSTVYHTEVMADSDIPSLNEKGEYSIKYITSGGYPNYGSNIGIYGQMMALAASRGDAVALVDAVCEKSRTLNPKNDQSLYYKLQAAGISNGSFGTMMFPWINTNLLNTYGKNQIEPKTTALMPASFAYLKCLATSLKQGNPNWLSIAGVTRGLVSNLVSDNPIETDKPVTNAIADYYQGTQPDGTAVSDTEFKYAINAITNIKPYGYCIWGNRTLAANTDGQKATNYLNIRNLVSDIKKVCYTSARRLMFEQNDDILWTKFLSYITPTLDKMNSGSGVSGYKVIKLATDEHAKLAAKIIIFPVYAVENFEITVELKDEEITVEE